MKNKLYEKLKSLGLTIEQTTRLVSLTKPEVSRRYLCANCFNNLVGAAKDKKEGVSLLSCVCEKCKQRITDFINNG